MSFKKQRSEKIYKVYLNFATFIMITKMNTRRLPIMSFKKQESRKIYKVYLNLATFIMFTKMNTRRENKHIGEKHTFSGTSFCGHMLGCRGSWSLLARSLGLGIGRLPVVVGLGCPRSDHWSKSGPRPVERDRHPTDKYFKIIIITLFNICTVYPQENYNQTFNINNFQNYELI